MKTNKRAVTVVTLALLLLSLCLTAAAEGEKTEIVFWYSLYGRNAQTIHEMVDDFNASQDAIHVDAQYQGNYDDALMKLKMAGLGHLPCDIVQSHDISLRYILDQNWMAPIQQYIDRDRYDLSVIEPNLLAYYTVEGAIDAMPFNCTTPLMYYNKTAFDEAGIETIPKTMDDVLEVAPLLTQRNPDGSIKRYGYIISNYAWFFEEWIVEMGREYVNAHNGREGTPTELLFGSNGAALDIFTMWAKIAQDENAGYIERGFTTQAFTSFINGETAIFFASAARLASVIDSVGDSFEVGTAFFPTVNRGDRGGVTAGSGSLWLVNSGNQDKMDAAWEFIKHMVSVEEQITWHMNTGYFPMNMDVLNTGEYQHHVEEYPQFKTALDQLHASRPEDVGPVLSILPELRLYIEDVTRSVTLGELTPKEAVEKLVPFSNDMLHLYNSTLQEEDY